MDSAQEFEAVFDLWCPHFDGLAEYDDAWACGDACVVYAGGDEAAEGDVAIGVDVIGPDSGSVAVSHAGNHVYCDV